MQLRMEFLGSKSKKFEENASRDAFFQNHRSTSVITDFTGSSYTAILLDDIQDAESYHETNWTAFL